MDQSSAAPSKPEMRPSGRSNRSAGRDSEVGDEARRSLGRSERAISIAGGGVLAAYGLRHRGVTGVALALAGAALLHRGVTGHRHAYESLGLDPSSERGRRWLVRQRGPSAVLDARRAVRVVQTITIGRPRAELYAYWRDLENLPRIMRNLESVRVVNRKRSRWTARGPAGRTVEWDALIHNEVVNELIAWKSVPGADVPNAGSVRFSDSDDGQGTVLTVTLEYAPPGGAVGSVVARLFGDDPARQVAEDLATLKQSLEAAPGGARRLADAVPDQVSRAN